jgi:hypothetical protein
MNVTFYNRVVDNGADICDALQVRLREIEKDLA